MDRLARAPEERLGAGVDGRLPEEGVEAGAGHGQAVARVRGAGEAGKPHATARWPDDDHVPHPLRAGHRDPELGEDLHPAGPDQVPARLVAREARSVDQRHTGTGPGQHEGSDAAGRSRPDHQHVETWDIHGAAPSVGARL